MSIMQQTQSRDARPAWSRTLLITLPILAVGLTGVAWVAYRWMEPAPAPVRHATRQAAPAPAVAPLASPPAASRAQPTPAQPTPAPPTPTVPPRFDIARIGKDGNAVIAGRAQPGATITILDNEQSIGEARADGRGEFVFLPEQPFAPGTRTLRLRQRATDGAETTGPEQLVLVVPPRGAGDDQPALAVLTPAEGAPRLLQGPPGMSPTALTLGLETVDYAATGDIRFAGSAPPGARLRLYVDNVPAGEATTDATGGWVFQGAADLAAGAHRLRLDQLAADGQVAARIEVPFQREARVAQLPPGQVVVQPGDSLWLLARQSYGQGTQYTAIYAANRARIRDPDLIYPGQVFAIPTAPGVSSTDPSSSRSR